MQNTTKIASLLALKERFIQIFEHSVLYESNFLVLHLYVPVWINNFSVIIRTYPHRQIQI